MSSLLSVELAATCNALGKFDPSTDQYLVDAFTLGTAKDLIRFLRRDGDDHEIRRHLGKTSVLLTDLVPMLVHHWQQAELFDVVLRLLVNLTNPVLLLYREEVPTERTARHNFLEILSHQQAYKAEAFTKVEFWDIIAKKLAQVLEINWQERTEDNGLIIERILILIRNVLQVPADDHDQMRPQSDASIHDQVLWALNRSNVLDILLYMSSENEQQYFMHILEIVCHLLREQNPSSLADAALHRSVDEKLRDEQELLSIRSTEMKQKTNKIKHFSASRHSRFGGTYVMQNMKSVSDNDIICLKPLNKISALDFGGKKAPFKQPKNRRPVEADNMERRSAFAIRLFLKEFCLNLLNGSYNPLLRHARDVLARGKAQPNDESYYLWVVRFFMEFNRGHNFQVGLVSETMSVEMFHYVQQQMQNYSDMMKVDRKKQALWARRLHLGLRAYKELLNTLQAMDHSADGGVRDSAAVLKSNIFYVVEYREFIIDTFLNYNETKMPRSYLIDLLETTHIFMKLLEQFCKKTGLVVQKKTRKKASKKKSKKSAPKSAVTLEPSVPHWEEVRAQLAAVMSVAELPHVAPFDAASDDAMDAQREECVKRIQKSMMECKYEEALSLLRAAREVWPEEGTFGVEGIPAEEELDMLEQIYVAELGVEIENIPPEPEDDQKDEDDEDEEEEETGPSAVIQETEFQFSDFVMRFCHPRVTSACALVLERFDTNSPHTNHCAVKMMHRIAWDCGLPAMLYQASLFVTFQAALDRAEPQHKELEKFAIFILRKFAEAAADEPKLFLELLFWKKMNDAREIQLGYVKYDHDDQGKPGAWTEVQEDELRTLYLENQKNPQTNQDVIDWLQENLVDQTRTRRQIIAKLKDMGLVFRAPTKRSNRDRAPKQFTQREDSALSELWETFGETSDPMAAIIERMPTKRSKLRLVERLLELGVIQDRKQATKKRTKKSDGKGSDRSDASGSDLDDDSGSRSDSDSGAPAASKQFDQKTKQVKQNTKKPKQKLEQVKQKRASKNASSATSPAELTSLLTRVVDDGRSSALRWLAECLEETALDLEAEGEAGQDEGVPLVPIEQHAAEAMRNKLFTQVVAALGIRPPSDEQEVYWRIPSSLHFETLHQRKQLILQAVDKTLVVEEETANQNETPPNDSSDDDVFSSLRRIRRLSEEPKGKERMPEDSEDEDVNNSGRHNRPCSDSSKSYTIRRTSEEPRRERSASSEKLDDEQINNSRRRKRTRSDSSVESDRRDKLQKIAEDNEEDEGDDEDGDSEGDGEDEQSENENDRDRNENDTEKERNKDSERKDEENEEGKEDEDDILGFAKRNLSDAVSSGDSDGDIVRTKRKRAIIHDDSD